MNSATRNMMAIAATMALSGAAQAQSSSLYTQPADDVRQRYSAQQQQQPADQGQARREAPSRLSPAIAEMSYTAVRIPEPEQYAVHDLVTIIIRESMDTDFSSMLETEKDVEQSGEITDFPNLQLRDLLNGQLRPGSMEEGAPRLGVGYDRSFSGEGDYRRRESITGRVAARVIDVKPNGTLVLEARKELEADDEKMTLVLTGTARVEDITVDNTVLSTQLYDLRLNKQHEGELRKTTRKGLFTKILEGLFNF